MINPSWLHTFCTLVELNHFTKTADKLYMTQSGVSQHIKKLEGQLDVPLLIRQGKSFLLTDAGKTLYQKGTELLTEFEQLEHQVRTDTPYEGDVKFASPGSIGLQLYPQLLSLQLAYPKLNLSYEFAPNTSVLAGIEQGTLDLGLSTELSRSGNVTSVEIATEALVLVTAKAVQRVTWQTLLTTGFISHPDAAHHAQLLLAENFVEFEHISQFEQRGFSNQIGLILKPVSLGLGFTVLPINAVKAFAEQDKIAIHPLPKAVSETLYLCYDSRANMPARVEFIKQHVTALVTGNGEV